METIIIQADSKKIKALKAFQIPFTVAKKEESPSPSDPAFVEKIQKRS